MLLFFFFLFFRDLGWIWDILRKGWDCSDLMCYLMMGRPVFRLLPLAQRVYFVRRSWGEMETCGYRDMIAC